MSLISLYFILESDIDKIINGNAPEEFKKNKKFLHRVNTDAYFIHNYSLIFLELYTLSAFSMMQYKHLVQTYRHFLLYIVKSYTLTKYSILPTFFFDNISASLNLNYPLASAVPLCLTLWWCFLTERTKTPLGFSYTFHTLPVRKSSYAEPTPSSYTPLLVSWLSPVCEIQRDSPCWLRSI